MTETWLTSDLHLGHGRVATLRGFDTTPDHDRHILDGLARRVAPGDRLYLLGDLAFGPAKDDHLRDIRAAVGEYVDITVVLGNHDRPHPIHRNGHRYGQRWIALFADNVVTTATLRHDGTTYLLSHYPYDGEGTTRPELAERDVQWRLPDHGRPLIHGHVHDPIRYRPSRNGTPMFHVGLDAWGLAPATIHEATQEAPDA